MPPKDIVQVLSEQFPDCPEELFDDIAEELRSPLQEAFQEEIRANVAALVQGPSAGQQRKRHANLQDKVQGLWNSTRLFEKALGLFEGDTESQLSRYLLRTLCTDLTNTVLFYLAEDSGLDTPSHGQGEMTAKERSTLISNLPEQMKRTLTAVNNSLNGKDVSSFFQLFEALCGEEYCGLMLKKADRKKERQLIFSHQQSLVESLREEQEPAMVLHLVVVLLFQQHTNCIIHLPGKLVPSIIAFLSSRLSETERSKLRTFQELVMLQLKQSRAPSSAQPAEPKTDTSLGQAEETQAASETVSKKVKKGSPAVGESGDSSGESGAVGSTSDTVQQGTDMMAPNLGDIMSGLKQLVLKPTKGDNQ